MVKSNIISLTPRAIERVNNLIDNSNQENKILRIGIEKGGCAGLHYSMDYVSEISDGDEVVEQDGPPLLSIQKLSYIFWEQRWIMLKKNLVLDLSLIIRMRPLRVAVVSRLRLPQYLSLKLKINYFDTINLKSMHSVYFTCAMIIIIQYLS